LPIEQCRKIGIEAGDEYESYVYENRITIVKKSKGAAKGLLKNIEIEASISDTESMQSGL
jgi:bifunctional DNA-binding transcriptional regulator/antitoxin component of YhaV-PrlF toxin-antitoxin module